MNDISGKPNDVVTVAGLREYLSKGWELHVLSREDAELRGPQWHGSWYLMGVDPDTLNWVVLVTTRDERRQRAKLAANTGFGSGHTIEYRELKTVSGLVKVLKELGFSGVGLETDGGKSIVLRYADTGAA
ncbi:hypothetical protein [Paracoccus cavernae]